MAFAEEDAPLVEPSGEDKILGVREAYARLWAVIKLPAVRRLSVILLTFRYNAAGIRKQLCFLAGRQ